MRKNAIKIENYSTTDPIPMPAYPDGTKTFPEKETSTKEQVTDRSHSGTDVTRDTPTDSFEVGPPPIHKHYDPETQNGEVCDKVFCPHGFVGIKRKVVFDADSVPVPDFPTDSWEERFDKKFTDYKSGIIHRAADEIMYADTEDIKEFIAQERKEVRERVINEVQDVIGEFGDQSIEVVSGILDERFHGKRETEY